MFEIKITATTLPELASAILAVAENYRTIPAGNDAAPADDKPKRTRAKAEPAAATDAAPAANKLEPADEGNAAANAGTSAASDTAGTSQDDGSTSSTSTTATSAASPSEPAGPTRDDALTAATKFSQTHGVEKLEAALEAVGAKKFSEVPVDKYAAFIAEMDKASAASSALS